jgi:hypothetical protein
MLLHLQQKKQKQVTLVFWQVFHLLTTIEYHFTIPQKHDLCENGNVLKSMLEKLTTKRKRFSLNISRMQDAPLSPLVSLDKEIWMKICNYFGVYYLDAYKRTCKTFWNLGTTFLSPLTFRHRPRFLRSIASPRKEYVLWLVQNKIVNDWVSSQYIVQNDHFALFEYLRDHNYSYHPWKMARTAIIYERLHFLEWLEKHHSEDLETKKLWDYAIDCRSLSGMKWLLQQDRSPTVQQMNQIYSVGFCYQDMDILLWWKRLDPRSEGEKTEVWDKHFFRCRPSLFIARLKMRLEYKEMMYQRRFKS